jgi:betaine-aldehyde dehydrogenase
MPSELFIGGRWQKPAEPETIPAFNPYTEQILHRVAAGGPRDVDRAVEAARLALPGWKRAGGAVRGRFLKAVAERIAAEAEMLAKLSSLNNGKPLAEARVDMADAAASFAYYAGLASELDSEQNQPVDVPDRAYRSRLRREPLGVAGLIVPWNFPLVTTSWKVAPALAAGCTVVLKPSEVTPLVELELGRIAEEIGLPPGVINIVTGTGTAVGGPLTAHPGVAKVSFTGSNAVGSRVMAACAAAPKPVGLELGGKSPIVVFASANEEMAADLVIGGIFYNAGQMCSATSRLIVEKRAAAHLLDRVVAKAQSLVPGDPLDAGTTIGPLTTKTQYDKVRDYIAAGRAEGLKLITGGDRPAHIDRGWFISPTIFADVPVTSRLWREEIFGPVLCVRTFEREEEAIALANDSDFGLVATIVSGDLDQADRVADAVEAGHVWINSPQTIFVETSWGGGKASGIGRELGPWGLSAYLDVKHKTERLLPPPA